VALFGVLFSNLSGVCVCGGGGDQKYLPSGQRVARPGFQQAISKLQSRDSTNWRVVFDTYSSSLVTLVKVKYKQYTILMKLKSQA
jgi:hypothetical protein